MSDLYDADILLWSEHQAALLKRLAAGERLNERPDWANIIEEMESVGRSEFHSVEGLLMQAIAHRLRAQLWPNSRELPSWLADARGFQSDALSRYTPSMKQRLDLAKSFRRAVVRMPSETDGVIPIPIPAECPYELDELLSEFSARLAIARNWLSYIRSGKARPLLRKIRLELHLSPADRRLYPRRHENCTTRGH